MDYVNEVDVSQSSLKKITADTSGCLPPPYSSEDMKPKPLTDVTAACILPEGILKHLLPERSSLLLEIVLHCLWASLSSVNSPAASLHAAGAWCGQCRCALASGLSPVVACHLPPLHSSLSGSHRPHTAAPC